MDQNSSQSRHDVERVKDQHHGHIGVTDMGPLVSNRFLSQTTLEGLASRGCRAAHGHTNF